MNGNDDELNSAIAKRMDTVISDVRAKAEEKLRDDISKLQERLEKEVKNRFITTVISIVSVAALVIVFGMYAQTRDVKTSVIDLQNSIISAQTVIRQSADELQRAKADLADSNSKLKAATDELTNTRAAYERLLEQARSQPSPRAP